MLYTRYTKSILWAQKRGIYPSISKKRGIYTQKTVFHRLVYSIFEAPKTKFEVWRKARFARFTPVFLVFTRVYYGGKRYIPRVYYDP